MAPLSTALFYIVMFAFTWSSCAAKSTLEEELQQLKESYVINKNVPFN
jgi:outer membrane lipoprotein-sorting protein